MEKLIETALSLIKPGMSVSFGGGRTVGRLIRALKDTSVDTKIEVSSPSETTRKLCFELDIPVVPLSQVTKFDVAFDGCDSLNQELNALKSNGGIHTFEKLYAQVSDKYIIMGPMAKYSQELDPNVQLTLEVLDLAMPQVMAQVAELGGTADIRQASELAGMVRTPNGNGLVDCHFKDWVNIDEIDATLAKMTGVMGTSYFKNLVTDALLATDDDVKHLRR